MKKILVAFALLLSLQLALPVSAAAKPTYCDTALIGCFTECRSYFFFELSQAGCNIGCYLGYSYCGT